MKTLSFVIFFSSILLFVSCSKDSSSSLPKLTADDLSGSWYVVEEVISACADPTRNRDFTYTPACSLQSCFIVDFTAEEVEFIYHFGFFNFQETTWPWKFIDEQTIEIGSSLFTTYTAKVELEEDQLKLRFDPGHDIMKLDANFGENCVRELALIRK